MTAPAARGTAPRADVASAGPLVQVAVDTMDPATATTQVRTAVAAGARRIELGRPLLDAVGLAGLEPLAALAAGTQVVLDTMILAAPGRYLAAARALGVSALTVSALAPDVTVAAAVRDADRSALEMVVDLFNAADPVERARRCVALGARSVMVHFGVDQQAITTERDRLGLLHAVVHAVPVTVSYAAYSIGEALAAARAGAAIVVQGESAVALTAAELAAHLARVRDAGISAPDLDRSHLPPGSEPTTKENHP